MKAVMFTAALGSPERQRFERAITAATLIIKSIYASLCTWQGDDLVLDGAQEDYQKLYFWICGYGDCEAVHDQDARECAGWKK